MSAPTQPAVTTRLALLAAALWWGSLGAVGLLAAPLLFAVIPSPALAGLVAAELFAAQTWVSIACCLGLLLFSKQKHAQFQEEWAQDAMVFVLGGALLALLLQYGIAPRIVARHNAALWHSVGVVLYGLQWLCALATLWRLSRR